MNVWKELVGPRVPAEELRERRGRYLLPTVLFGVAAVGPGVSAKQARVGQRVMDHHYYGCGVCKHCRQGWSQLCGDGFVVYGVTGGKEQLGRGLRQSELERATPYNTYVVDRLPPTPIAAPGRDAIMAVVNPEQTDFLYFVADGTGGHVFASTLNEHNRNVAAYRQLERANQ